jgi:hypothetical protein
MSSSEAPPSGKGFWTSLPGILTGLAALVTAVGTIIGVVVTQRDDNPEPGPDRPPIATVSVAPTVDPNVPLDANPQEAEPSALAQAPANQCPFRTNGFWMPLQSTPYGPFGNGYFLAWDAFGFYVWDPTQAGWVPYPDPQTRNAWVKLTGAPFSGCVAGAGSPVFGEYTG